MARKEKYISLRADGRWVLRMSYGYRADGSPALLQEYFPSREEARRRRDLLLARKGAGQETRATGYTLGAWALKCLDLYGSSLQNNTFLGYASRIKIHILPAPISRRRLEDVDAVALQAWINGLRKHTNRGPAVDQPLSPKSVRNIYGVMTWVLTMALKAGLIPRVPDTAALTLPRRALPRRATMTPDVCSSLLSALEGTPYHAVLLVALTTGLRTSEIFGLCWDCVDLDSGVYTIRRKLTLDRAGKKYIIADSLKTDNSFRTGIFVPEVRAALRDLQRRQRVNRMAAGPLWKNTGAVFVREDGSLMSPRALRSILVSRQRKLGLPRVGMHGLRHLYATSLIRQRVDDATIAAQLGHSSADYTRRQYADVYDDSARIASEAGAVLLAQIVSNLCQPD